MIWVGVSSATFECNVSSATFREAKLGQSPAKPPMRSLHEVTNVEASLRKR